MKIKKCYIMLMALAFSVFICISCGKDGQTGVKGEIEGYNADDNIKLVLWEWNHSNLITGVVATLTPDSKGEYIYTGLTHGLNYSLTIYSGSTQPKYSSPSNTKSFMANEGSMYVIKWKASGDGWTTTTSWE